MLMETYATVDRVNVAVYICQLCMRIELNFIVSILYNEQSGSNASSKSGRYLNKSI